MSVTAKFADTRDAQHVEQHPARLGRPQRPLTSESLRAATLLSRHRDREPVLGFDEVILAVVADVDLHPVDLTGKLVAGGAVVRGCG